MSLRIVPTLGDRRARRERRLELALALAQHDAQRSRVLHELADAIPIAGGDRAAVFWIDEYGPALVHPRTVLDLGSDRPRLDCPMEPLRRAWERGVPGLWDVPGRAPESGAKLADQEFSRVAISLGSDGLRIFFVVVDGQTPRESLDRAAIDRLLFISGRCAGLPLHADLDHPRSEDQSAGQAFTGWPVLRDLDGRTDTTAEDHRRVAIRFLVVRAVRTFAEDDFAVDGPSLLNQVEGIRGEMGDFLKGDPERERWTTVLDRLEASDLPALGEAALDLADFTNAMDHPKATRELQDLGYRIAEFVADPALAVRAAYSLATSTPLIGETPPAIPWDEVARGVEPFLEDPTAPPDGEG